MKLLVDGITVQAAYVQMGSSGTFLQLLLADKVLFSKLAEEFEHHLPTGGVISTNDPDDDGNYKIRLLEWTKLETIDQMRSHGHGICQLMPDKDDV